jgi:hypothetical protein
VRQTVSILDNKVTSFSDNAFIIGCFCNSEFKVDLTLKLIEEIRNRFDDIVIITSSHLQIDNRIQSLSDYSIYNKNNPIINLDIKTKISSDRYMSQHIFRSNGTEETVGRLDFTHSYAQHLSIRDGFKTCLSNRIKYAHYLNYDLPHHVLDRLDSHIFHMKDERYDGVFYSYYHKQFYCTEFFSMKVLSYDQYFGEVLSFNDWIQHDSYHTEEVYLDFLKDADIKCLGNYHDDSVMGDCIGQCVFGGTNDNDEITRVSVLNSKCANHIIIPYKTDDETRINVSGPSFEDPSEESDIKWESFDDMMLFINVSIAKIARQNWCEYVVPENAQYIKIYVNDKLRAFFDITDERNLGERY